MADGSELISQVSSLISSQVQLYQSQIKQLEADLSSSTALVRVLEQEKLLMKNNLAEYESVFKDQKQMEIVIAQLRSELEAARKALSDEEKQNMTRYTNVVASSKALKADLENLNQNNQELQIENSKLKEELKEKGIELSKRANMYESKVVQTAGIREELLKLKKEKEIKEAKLEAAVKEMQEYKAKMSKQNKRIKDLRELETTIFKYVESKKPKTKSVDSDDDEESDVNSLCLDINEDDLNSVDLNETTPLALIDAAKQQKNMFVDEL